MNNVIIMPINGETTHVNILSDQAIALPFDVELASVEREGDDLVFIVPDGRVALDDFFTLDMDALPSFVLADGVFVAGGELLTAFDAENLITASGSESSLINSNGSSGGTHYEADPGESIEGVGTLDALSAMEQQSRASSYKQGGETPLAMSENLPSALINAESSTSGYTSAAETTDYNMLFVVQLNTMDARLWNDKTEATADYGGYKAALAQVQGMLADFCTELQGTGAGTVNFGAVMFASSNKNVREVGPISFDADDPQSVAEACAALEEQFNALMGQGFYDSGSNFEAAFEAASAYVQNNADLWSNPDSENKVMFISNGQASGSNFVANYDGEGKAGWLNKGNVIGDGKEDLSTSNSISSTQYHKVTVNGVSDVIAHNEFQAAVDSFNAFVDAVNALGGSALDVHALGICANYGNSSIGRNLTQYQQEVLSFFDNTGSITVYDGEKAWAGKASSSGNALTATGEQAETGFVHELSLIGKQLVATIMGEEYTARGVTANDIETGNYAANDENGIYYLDGKVAAAFGDGDNIVYLGAGKSDIELGDGDNYVNFVYYNGNTVTAGAGDNYLHINGTGNKITLSQGAEETQGNDTIVVTGDSNTINAGAGNDLLIINSNGNTLTLGEGHDTVVLDFKTATAAGETVFINGKNTVTDFKIGEDTLDISKIVDIVGEKSGETLNLETYLSKYAEVSLNGNDLHIILNHAGDIEGYRRGTGKNGEDWSYSYKIDGGEVTAQSEVVLQNFTQYNPEASFSTDEAALQSLLNIMNG